MKRKYQAAVTLGRRGGLARAKKMSPEERKKSAMKAARAAAKVHRAKRKKRGK